MIKAAGLLRETADDFERRAKNVANLATQAEFIDISVKWRFWLQRSKGSERWSGLGRLRRVRDPRKKKAG